MRKPKAMSSHQSSNKRAKDRHHLIIARKFELRTRTRSAWPDQHIGQSRVALLSAAAPPALPTARSYEIGK